MIGVLLIVVQYTDNKESYTCKETHPEIQS